MKKVYPVLIGALLTILAACSKKLEITPEDALTEKMALTTQKNAEGVLASAYLELFHACRGSAYSMADESSGILDFPEFRKPNLWYEGTYSARTSEVEPLTDFWSPNYKTINLANVLIKSLPEVAAFDTQLVKQIVGEAKFIRALCYFNLLKFYGDGALNKGISKMGVPLRLQPYDGYDGSQIIPRNTNGEVYTQILKDIEEAIPDLLDRFPNELATRTRAVKGSAQALGARVALYMRNYGKALSFSDAVLQNANYSNATSILDVFADNSTNEVVFGKTSRLNINIPEIIFAFPVSYSVTENHMLFYFDVNQFFYHPAFLAGYESNDIRANELFITTSYYGMPTASFSRKFTDPGGVDNLIMFRRAEFVLTKAEVLARLNGVNQESVDLLNEIHQRSFAPDNRPLPLNTGDFTDDQQLISRILQERQWEFAGEGMDRFDKIRSDIPVNPVLPKAKYVLPIPYQETLVTGGVIKQNPEY